MPQNAECFSEFVSDAIEPASARRAVNLRTIFLSFELAALNLRIPSLLRLALTN